MESFEERLRQDLVCYLVSVGRADAHLPECPDIEEKWGPIAQAYLPDGIREFAAYPNASLGWMMYMGIAVAKYWDEDWAVYGNLPNLYTYIRDKRGYDNLDEYVRDEALSLKEEESDNLEKLIGECASRTNNFLRRQPIEPGTKEAFDAYVSCLHQLYLMGAAVQLKHMGYHMTKIN